MFNRCISLLRFPATDAADKEANSLATLERDADRLIAAGVNQIIYHGFPYVYLDRAEPGWYPLVDPASFSDHFSDHNTKIWPTAMNCS